MREIMNFFEQLNLKTSCPLSTEKHGKILIKKINAEMKGNPYLSKKQLNTILKQELLTLFVDFQLVDWRKWFEKIQDGRSLDQLDVIFKYFSFAYQEDEEIIVWTFEEKGLVAFLTGFDLRTNLLERKWRLKATFAHKEEKADLVYEAISNLIEEKVKEKNIKKELDEKLPDLVWSFLAKEFPQDHRYFIENLRLVEKENKNGEK